MTQSSEQIFKVGITIPRLCVCVCVYVCVLCKKTESMRVWLIFPVLYWSDLGLEIIFAWIHILFLLPSVTLQCIHSNPSLNSLKFISLMLLYLFFPWNYNFKEINRLPKYDNNAWKNKIIILNNNCSKNPQTKTTGLVRMVLHCSVKLQSQTTLNLCFLSAGSWIHAVPNKFRYLYQRKESESHSVLSDFVTTWTSSWGQITGMGRFFPSPVDLPNPGI